MTEWDAPNQQVVRADQSAPWEEGTGGAPPPDEIEPPVEPAPEVAAEDATPSLDEMTKEQLLTHAQNLGISPANHAMTKDELRTSIDQKLAEGG
jgi:hypothetical protein